MHTLCNNVYFYERLAYSKVTKYTCVQVFVTNILIFVTIILKSIMVTLPNHRIAYFLNIFLSLFLKGWIYDQTGTYSGGYFFLGAIQAAGVFFLAADSLTKN